MLKWYMNLTNKITKSRKGASMVEYALVVAAIGLIAILGFNALGGAVNNNAGAAAVAVG